MNETKRRIAVRAPKQKTKKIKTAFSEQLRKVIKEAGIKSAREASKIIEGITGIDERKVYSHLLGERLPPAGSMMEIARTYVAALEQQTNRKISITPLFDSTGGDPEPIPAVTVSLHEQADTGNPVLTQVVFPQPLAQEGDLFLWRVEEGDMSLVGPGYDIIPGTYLIGDRASTIRPGHIVLCVPYGFERPVLRLFKAAGALSQSADFSLISPNPLFKEIHIRGAGECRMLGRIRFSINHW